MRSVLLSATAVAALSAACDARAQATVTRRLPSVPSATPPAGKTVGEVVVTGEKAPIQTSIDRRSYSVRGDLQVQGGNIGDALRNIPSVEVDVQGNVSLRGDSNVTIMIDGKPSGLLRGENRGQALQQMPADRIERVEVITNPSAEFRADGSGGIINLITRQARGVGRTGSFRVLGATGDRYGAGGNIGYNSKTLTLAGDLFYRHEGQETSVVEERSQLSLLAGGFADSLLTTGNNLKLDAYSTRGSFDYDVDPATRISGEARLQYGDFLQNARSRFVREDVSGAVVQAFDRNLDFEQLRWNGEVSGTLRRKFKGDGHQLVLNLNYEETQDDRARVGVNDNALPVPGRTFDDQRFYGVFEQTQVKGDYTRPMGPGVTLKAGFDVQYDDNSYDLRFFTGANYVPDPLRTNLFLYERTLTQGYVTYERPFGKLTVLAGLRLEDARIDLDQVTQDTQAENDDFSVYPSLHLGWKRSDTQQFSASYSLRVQRPLPEDYNPARITIDPVTFRTGNPRLDPQETHSFELGWQYRKSPSFYTATLYFRDNEKVISDVSRDVGGGVIQLTKANVSRTLNGGLELVAAGRLTKKLSYNVSGNAYWSEIDASRLGFGGDRSTVTLSGRASLSWQATPNDLFQATGFLNGKRLTAQGFVEPTGMLNLGYRHKFNDRVSLLVQAQDVLDTFRFEQVVDTPTLKTRTRNDANIGFVGVGLVFTFGGGRQREPTFDFGPGAGPPT